jgi:hypothetical protein
VVFVPSTKGGALTRKLREREEVLAGLTGFKIRSRSLEDLNWPVYSAQTWEKVNTAAGIALHVMGQVQRAGRTARPEMWFMKLPATSATL